MLADDNRERALTTLLEELFDPDELLRIAHELDRGLYNELFGRNLGLRVLADELLRKSVKRGLVDAAFFAILHRERPKRWQRINEVAAAFFVTMASSAAESASRVHNSVASSIHCSVDVQAQHSKPITVQSSREDTTISEAIAKELGCRTALNEKFNGPAQYFFLVATASFTALLISTFGLHTALPKLLGAWGNIIIFGLCCFVILFYNALFVPLSVLSMMEGNLKRLRKKIEKNHRLALQFSSYEPERILREIVRKKRLLSEADVGSMHPGGNYNKLVLAKVLALLVLLLFLYTRIAGESSLPDWVSPLVGPGQLLIFSPLSIISIVSVLVLFDILRDDSDYRSLAREIEILERAYELSETKHLVGLDQQQLPTVSDCE